MTTEERIPLGVNLSFWERSLTWPALLDVVRMADDLGYAHVTISESFGRDGLVVADRLLAASSGIDVCFGVANPFSRSPAVLAAAAATLDELSAGRFVLGLGSSTPNLVEGWHGLEFERPLQRMRETVTMCRRIWARDSAPYVGEVFQAGGVKLAFEPYRRLIPFWSGSLLEQSLVLTGELFDGWMPGLMPAEHVEWGIDFISQGRAGQGRAPGSVAVVPTYSVCADEPEALDRQRFAVAMYYGSPGSPYAKAAAAVGFASDVAAIQEAYTAGGARSAASAVSDRLVRSVAIVGSTEQCRDEIEARLAAGADRISVVLPARRLEDCESILRGLRPPSIGGS